MSPDKRQHRGAHPADQNLFDAPKLAILRRATSELSWLLGRGYAVVAAVKLVGDRYSLTARQRLAVSRAACSDSQRERRGAHSVSVEHVAAMPLVIDGFNLIITVEAALGGGLLVTGRDRVIRDLSSVHGSYRAVEETDRAIQLVGEALCGLRPKSVRWLLDKPVSNSGRLAQRIRHLAVQYSWPWTVEVVFNPDRMIQSSAGEIAVTSDSMILDHAPRWINLGGHLVKHYLTHSWLIDLSYEDE